MLQNWKIRCRDRNRKGKIQNFIRSTRTNSPPSHSGAESLPPIGNAFIYIEKSSVYHGDGVFCSWDRTSIIQITNKTFCYDRFSILSDVSLKSMGRFRILLLLKKSTWSTQYKIAKNTQYSDNPSDWTLLNLDFYCRNLWY